MKQSLAVDRFPFEFFSAAPADCLQVLGQQLIDTSLEGDFKMNIHELQEAD